MGGLFLLYKSTKEIYEKVELRVEDHHQPTGQSTLNKAILQITLINLVFSVDSILTALGIRNGLPYAGLVMEIAIVVSVLIMMLFAHPVGNFVNQHPSLQVLGLSFSFIDLIYAFGRGSPFVAYRNIGAASGINPQRISLFRYYFFVGGGIYQYEAKGETKKIIYSI